jgi:PadR family transcriptional regulator AphA
VSLPAAILGFLSLEPASGYNLKRRFEVSVGSFWSVTQSQIYRELHALSREGFVVVGQAPGQGKAAKKIYELSKSGRKVLEAWLRQPLEPVQLRHPLLLKFVFSGDVEPEVLDGLLEHYRSSLERTQADHAALLAAIGSFGLARSEREMQIWRLSIEHGLAWCELEMAWIDRARATLQPARPKAARSRRKKKK